MKFSTLLRVMRFWPPFWGAGIRVQSFNEDYTSILVQMKMHFWNKNYVGSHFGGSLYSMTDPFYMLMLMKHLGKNHIIWDKTGSIRYKKPAFGPIYARFELTTEQLQDIKDELSAHAKSEPVFQINIVDGEGNIVAEVNKVLSVKVK